MPRMQGEVGRVDHHQPPTRGERAGVIPGIWGLCARDNVVVKQDIFIGEDGLGNCALKCAWRRRWHVICARVPEPCLEFCQPVIFAHKGQVVVPHHMDGRDLALNREREA